MKPSAKPILKWCVGGLLLFILAGMLFPRTNYRSSDAIRHYTRDRIARVDLAFRAYQEKYGTYPPGGPKEMVAALTGKNRHGTEFMMLKESDFNQDGELIDDWKTPFRFSRISETEPPQLTSAGPDKVFGTRDDVTLTNR